MRIDVRHNLGEFKAAFESTAKQTRFAMAVALTRVAQDAKTAVQGEMRRVFDRPTSFTLRSVFVERATKETLTSRVWLKEGTLMTPDNHFLRPQVFGASRGTKPFEKVLQQWGRMPSGMVAVPAAGAKLDAFGNVSRGQIVQILSQLRVRSQIGYESRASGSKRSNKTIARQGVTYFVVLQKTGGLVPGIWLRRKFGHGSAVKPVFIYVSAASYKPRLKFFETAQRVADQNLRGHYEAALERANATAK